MDAEFKSPEGRAYVLPPNPQAARNLTMIVYALQAVALVTGLPLLVAAIINYLKKEEVRGTWLESHFRWQIRTFWFSLLWSAIGAITFVAVIGYFILLADLVWLVYRIARGWLNLANGQTMYSG